VILNTKLMSCYQWSRATESLFLHWWGWSSSGCAQSEMGSGSDGSLAFW